jgi:sulfite exporter TauE/SafE
VGGPLFQRAASLLARRAPGNALLTGLLLGLLPCGLVYSALIAATARGGPVQGATALVLFGVGTAPALLGLSVVDELLARHRARLGQLSALFLLLMGGWFVWQGLQPA